MDYKALNTALKEESQLSSSGQIAKFQYKINPKYLK